MAEVDTGEARGWRENRSFKDQMIRWVQEGEEGGECQGRH